MILFMFSAVSAADLAPEVQRSEELANAGDLAGLVSTLESYTAAHPDDPEALWRLSRAYYEKGEVLAQSVPDSQRLVLYEKALDLAKRTVTLAPDNGLGYLWEGAALARIGTAKGVLASLRLADDIEGLWLTALQKPTTYRLASGISSFPGDVYFGLGQFYRLVPDWKVVEWVAGTRGDIDKSVSYMRKLVKAEPQRIEGMKELGVSLLCKGYKMGDDAAKSEGRMWLNRAASTSGSYPTDLIDKRHVPLILARESEACGYSRDGWEDVSEAAYASHN